MKSIIEKIYFKEVGYREMYPDDKIFKEQNAKFEEAYEALKKSLNGEQREMLSELDEYMSGLEGVLEYLYFKDGFCAGLRLGLELNEEAEKKVKIFACMVKLLDRRFFMHYNEFRKTEKRI